MSFIINFKLLLGINYYTLLSKQATFLCPSLPHFLHGSAIT